MQVNGNEEKTVDIKLENKNNIVKFIYNITGDIELWNEHNPYLCELTCKLQKDNYEIDKKVIEFGMREIRTEGRHIILNVERIFFFEQVNLKIELRYRN